MNKHGIFLRRTVLVCLAAAAVVLVACSSSTDPGGGGGEVEITYSPTAVDLTVTVGGGFELRATVTGTNQADIAWTVGGAAVATGPVYQYQPTTVGVDTIAVAVTAGSTTGGRAWRVTVNPDASLLPPVVTGITVGHGPAPGEVRVAWLRATATHFPLVDYVVAASYSGPIDGGTWDQATVLGTYPQAGAPLQPSLLFGAADGMIPGAQIWCSVRARDDRGQLSPISGAFTLVISTAWTLELLVVDDAGLPLQNAILSYGGAEPATTDAQGRASIGPLRSVDTIAVSALVDPFHYTYDTGPLVLREDPLTIVLPEDHTLVHVPCGTADYADFLDYLRSLTWTDGSGERGTLLNTWDHYPLTVWIPAATSATLGWDLQALAADALPIWNATMGEDYLVPAVDAASADVVFAFRDLPDPYKGLTRLLQPNAAVGDTIPEQMEVAVESVLDQIPNPQSIWVTEIALHELGHVLGHYGHTCSVNKGNLMDSGGATGSLADGPENAINLDEQRLIRCVRTLTPRTDMAGYGVR